MNIIFIININILEVTNQIKCQNYDKIINYRLEPILEWRLTYKINYNGSWQ